MVGVVGLACILLECSIVNIAADTPKYLENSSTSGGYFAWGSDTWQPGTHKEKEYAETRVVTIYTQSLTHPTYLNANIHYSQNSGTVTVGIYISTSQQMVIDVQNSPYHHSHWWNGDNANFDHYVGQAVVDGAGELVSFDIESWISSNPSDQYYIAFINNNLTKDAVVEQVWLGPQGTYGKEEEKAEVSKSVSLQQNKPNPVLSTTSIEYNIPKKSYVCLEIYNETGQLVKTLYNGEVKEGNHTTIWDGKTIEGKKAPSGNYFYALKVKGKTVTKKAIVLQ
ncbi:MAG: FlgD immunoglobulin-like domain containing protein [bacterium]